jgi:PAS domain S-box-containing protein
VLAEADASIRNFVKTRRNDELGPYEAAPTRTREVLTQIAQITQGDAPQQARAKQLEAGVETRFELYRKQLETQSATPPRFSARPIPPAPNEAEVQGERQTAEIAKLLAEIRRREFDRLPALAAAAQAKVSGASRLAPIAGVLSIWMVLLAALLLYRDTTRRAYAGVERRMQTRIVETLPLGVCLADQTGLILYTNSAQDSLFGYEPGGLVGRHITSVHHNPRGGGDDLFDGAMEDLRSQGSWRGDFVAKRKNSTTFNCASQAISMEMSGKSYRLFLMAGVASPPEASTPQPSA